MPDICWNGLDWNSISNGPKFVKTISVYSILNIQQLDLQIQEIDVRFKFSRIYDSALLHLTTIQTNDIIH